MIETIQKHYKKESRLRRCLEIDYSSAFEDLDLGEDLSCMLDELQVQRVRGSKGTDKYPSMDLSAPKKYISPEEYNAPDFRLHEQDINYDIICLEPFLAQIADQKRRQKLQEDLQLLLLGLPQSSYPDEEYSDAEEEVDGPGPSGNRKMIRKPLHKRSPNRKKQQIPPVKTTISRVIGVPDVAITRLQYNDVISLTGTTAQYTFRANSLFDPDFTGTGHQPSYFDQYIASYERYRVLSCSISISVVNRSFTDPAMVVVFPVTEVPTITSISQAAEIARHKKTGILPSYQSIPINRSVKISTAEQIGLMSPSTVYTDDYAALFNANPVVLWYYGLYGWSPTSGGLDVIIDVQLVFDCQFFDRAPSTLSLDQQLIRQTKICHDIDLSWKKRCLDKKIP